MPRRKKEITTAQWLSAFRDELYEENFEPPIVIQLVLEYAKIRFAQDDFVLVVDDALVSKEKNESKEGENHAD